MNDSLRILPQAQADFFAHVQYLAVRNPAAAQRFHKAVDDIFDQLLRHGELGECCQVFNSLEGTLRILMVSGFSNYVLFYRELDARIEIVRLLHGSQDWQQALFQ